MTQPHRMTEVEFLALPETMDRVELIDGEVKSAPRPCAPHQRVLQRLCVALSAWRESTAREVYVGLSPCDVRLAAGRIVQPDLFVIRGPFEEPLRGPIAAVPALCIEVLSEDRDYDRFMKRRLYAEAGVQELWTIEPGGFAEIWRGEGLEGVTEVTDALESPILPGFRLSLAALNRR